MGGVITETKKQTNKQLELQPCSEGLRKIELKRYQ